MSQALIVDDSKTARVSLRKMLEKQQISSAMVECAEDALEYLQENRPTMIFMDHMMPGMDGFDAVKVIKADPEKASIPIVMYTTKQGDIYVGQARALGAADILSKPANEKSLIEVLQRVEKIIEEQSKEASPALSVVETVAEEEVNEHEAVLQEGSVQKQELPPLEEETTTAAIPISDTAGRFQNNKYSQAFWGLSLRQGIMLALWLAPILWLLALYIPADNQREQLLLERSALYQSIEWVINKSEGFDYGEPPMGGERLEILEGLVSHLAAAKFTGTIRLEGHMGEFCVTKVALHNGSRMNMLPSIKLPLSQCASIGVSEEKALELSGQQSELFKQFLATSPLLTSSGINVEVIKYGTSQPKYDYPKITESTTVGDWNSVALSNNRVNFSLLPSR